MDLFDFADQQEEIKEPYMPRIGDHVLVPSINQSGVVNYIDQRTLFCNEYFPIQVILDKAYDYSDLIRTNLKDIKRILS